MSVGEESGLWLKEPSHLSAVRARSAAKTLERPGDPGTQTGMETQLQTAQLYTPSSAGGGSRGQESRTVQDEPREEEKG